MSRSAAALFPWKSTALACATLLVAHAVRAAGVVGTGTAASCTDAALDAALTGGGLVTFNCGGPATIDISAGTGTKMIAADTTVDGAGLLTISGGNSVEVFNVRGGVHFTVENLTMANGLGSASRVGRLGGGIFNGGALSVINSTFTGNSDGLSNVDGASATITDSTFVGNTGGITNGGAMAITNSTFIRNRRAAGAGILNFATLSVANSTFTGNSADNAGGAILNFSGTLTITNSTFVGNSTGIGSGAIDNGDTLTLTNSTVSGNSGGGAGISNLGYLTITNTIVTNNLDGNCFDSGVTDGGHDLDDGTSCGFSAAKGSLSNTNPQLDPAGLRNNGGPTQTVGLCTAAGVPAGCTAASPAISAGDQAVCAAAPVNDLDQRGFARPGTGHTHCSIGAYEADAIAPAACAGDCDGMGIVTVDELITLVNIALGSVQPSVCPHGVPSGASVDIVLILQAVNHALSGAAPDDRSDQRMPQRSEGRRHSLPSSECRAETKTASRFGFHWAR